MVAVIVHLEEGTLLYGVVFGLTAALKRVI